MVVLVVVVECGCCCLISGRSLAHFPHDIHLQDLIIVLFSLWEAGFSLISGNPSPCFQLVQGTRPATLNGRAGLGMSQVVNKVETVEQSVQILSQSLVGGVDAAPGLVTARWWSSWSAASMAAPATCKASQARCPDSELPQ